MCQVQYKMPLAMLCLLARPAQPPFDNLPRETLTVGQVDSANSFKALQTQVPNHPISWIVAEGSLDVLDPSTPTLRLARSSVSKIKARKEMGRRTTPQRCKLFLTKLEPLTVLRSCLDLTIDQFSGCKVIFFDAGTYIVTDTLVIPPGSLMTGEAWSQIMITGSKFQNINSPHVGIQVGASGASGIVEISDMIFTTRGPSEY